MQPAFEALARRLDPQSRSPLAVAFSGGGDSLALLLLTLEWARPLNRPVVALTVDHGLQAQSRRWTRAAGETAQGLGAAFTALSWTADKPASGLPAAARTARHALLAAAARAAGAGVILLGHTADDQMENALMAQEGRPLGALKEWRPSPAWPQGRGLFLLRPLLDLRRAHLRAWLAGQGHGWLDDPANDDLGHPRVRARRRLDGGEGAPIAPPLPDTEALARLAQACAVTPWGGASVPREVLRAAPEGAALRFLQIAVACVAGAPALSRPERAAALLARLRAREAVIATLGGARIVADRTIFITREAGELARGAMAPMWLDPGRPAVWDGRFEAVGARSGLRVTALKGFANRLNSREKQALRAIPASARGGLPTVHDGGGGVSCPILAGRCDEGAPVHLTGLVEARLKAACGLKAREDETGLFADMANWGGPSYVTPNAKGF